MKEIIKEKGKEILRILESTHFYISLFLQFGIFAFISSMIHAYNSHPEWYIRFAVSILCFGLYTLTKQNEEIIQLLKREKSNEKLYS